MALALSVASSPAEQDRRIAEALARDEDKLRKFIRRRVVSEGDVEDILQDVFYELVEAYRLMKPIEQVSGWVFRVAANRITDLFRKKKPEPFPVDIAEAGDTQNFADLLPSPDAGPDAAYAHGVLLEELAASLDELPDEQREVFVAHELEGRSFKELAAESGLNVNTLLSRKHYAVLHLRRRLQSIHDDFVNPRG